MYLRNIFQGLIKCQVIEDKINETDTLFYFLVTKILFVPASAYKNSLHVVTWSTKFLEALVGAGTEAQVKPLPSEDGTQLRNELGLEICSAGDLFDSLGELSGSLADIPGSVGNTSD